MKLVEGLTGVETGVTGVGTTTEVGSGCRIGDGLLVYERFLRRSLS